MIGFSLIFPITGILAQFRIQNIPYITPSNCTSRQYYNRIDFRCEICPNTTIPSADKLECRCLKQLKFNSMLGVIAACEPCPEGTFASPDQKECLECREGTCQCSSRNILTYRNPDGSFLSNGSYCSTCSTGFKKDGESSCRECDTCECDNCTATEQMYTRVKTQNGNEMRSSFIETQMPKAIKLCAQRLLAGCEALLNLCVLQNYEQSTINACGYLDTIKRSYNPWQSTWDPQHLNDDSELERENAIAHQYVFDGNSMLDLVFARYDVNGTFEGYIEIDSINFHFCGPDSPIFFTFGRKSHRECTLSKSKIHFPDIRGKLFEGFLRFTDSEQIVKMYPIFVLNSAIRTNNQITNLLTHDRNRWALTRRFFLADDYSIQFDNSTKLYRFASRVVLLVTMQKGADGFIFPPVLSIEYDDSIVDSLFSSFSIEYFKDPTTYDQRLIIFLLIFISISLFWAALCAYSWGRRMGKSSAVDASSIIYFLIREVSILGDVFFAMFTVIACWITWAYKSQTYVLYNILSDEQQYSLFRFIVIAMILKFFGLLITMGLLVFQETFFIDWERQKLRQVDDIGQPASRDLSKNTEIEPVVVWRTYLIANEWNELQQYRKISLPFQLLALIILHEYFNFKNYAIIEPGFHRYNSDPLTSQTVLMSRLAVVLFYYLLIAAIQWILQVLIVERIIVDPFHNFIDLCSVSNISVLSLTHSLYGFYIHGRSVHGKGDAGMSEMNIFLQRERDNLCGFRGLEPNSELQTFTVNLPIALRQKYDEIHAISRQNITGAVGQDAITAKMNATVEAHDKMNSFLKNFVDHSLNEIDYVVRDRPILEAILDCEMSDSSITGTFTRDPSEIMYSRCFVYGNEWAWTSFECLTLAVLFILFDSIHFACFAVFVISNIIRLEETSSNMQTIVESGAETPVISVTPTAVPPSVQPFSALDVSRNKPPSSTQSKTDKLVNKEIANQLNEYAKNTLSNFPWFHGLMLKESAEPLLKWENSFVVRRSQDSAENKVFCISIRQKSAINHISIIYEDKRWSCPKLLQKNGKSNEKKDFAHIHEMLDYWSLHNDKMHIPIPRSKDILKHKVVRTSVKLGSGAFGEVWKGTVKMRKSSEPKDCAIKMIKGDLNRKQMKEFFHEAKIMSLFEHNCVIRYYGMACLADPVMMVMELVPKGTVRSFCRHSPDATTEKFIKFSYDIASGMEHLASKWVIHRDLAARNCLIGSDDNVKISDFGLSVQSVEVKVANLKQAPIRWLSPETLNKGIFNEKTDVWSYGVVLWEIFTKCSTKPLHDMSNKTVIKTIKQVDVPHSPPKGAPADIVQIMIECFKKNPNERPTFIQLKNRIKKIMETYSKCCEKKMENDKKFTILPRNLTMRRKSKAGDDEPKKASKKESDKVIPLRKKRSSEKQRGEDKACFEEGQIIAQYGSNRVDTEENAIKDG
ncbi:unnamed protein product [Caenorhabditis bovis]|uniref:non-specific protein-tyrosine kinase n=1 Tax=Caenorhabditis bovis TaxID=2654633 RepID=A0A8S1ESK7_9PELO|nr:unnamed protein product [Caenorhabditis bovis]